MSQARKARDPQSGLHCSRLWARLVHGRTARRGRYSIRRRLRARRARNALVRATWPVRRVSIPRMRTVTAAMLLRFSMTVPPTNVLRSFQRSCRVVDRQRGWSSRHAARENSHHPTCGERIRDCGKARKCQRCAPKRGSQCTTLTIRSAAIGRRGGSAIPNFARLASSDRPRFAGHESAVRCVSDL
jgi:hypothetical protein